MAMRIRSLKPEFWASFTIARLSEPALILAIGLLNHSCDRGYFEADPRIIKSAIFPLREPSRSIPGALAELSRIDYITLRNAPDGRLVGHVINFSSHQRIDKPAKQLSKAHQDFEKGSPSKEFEKSDDATPTLFQEDYKSTPGGLQEDSRKKPAGSGIRDQGDGSGSVEGARAAEPEVWTVVPDSIRRDVDRLPESLNTPAFRSAWEKWLVYCGETYSKGRPMSLATSDAHLKICLKLGPERGIGAIENAISRQLREPAEPFKATGSAPRQTITEDRYAKPF